ncbi:phage tail tape measure protein, partial [Candidatus Woesearchaeota archaeon]
MSLGRDISVRVVLKGIDQASPSIRKVSRSFKTLRGEAQVVSKSMLAAVTGIKRYAGEIRSPLQFSEGAMRKLRREANKVAITIPKANKQFRVFGVTLRTLSAGIQSVIGGLIGFSILSQIASWVREGINSFIEFEAESVKLAAQAREAGQDINMLAQIFRTVASAAAREYAVSAQDALNALEALVKAGLSGQEAISALGSTIMMARLESIDFEKASNNLVQVMSQFGLNGAEAARVVDTLVNASRLGIGAASDFAEGLGNCGATAKAMGLSLEDAATWLVVLERRLGDAREAGTHFNRFMLELYEIADKLGVPIRDVNGRLRDTNEVILDVIEASKSLGGDFETLQKRLTGVDTRALKVLFTFTQMKEDFKELRKEVSKQKSTWEAYNAWLKTTQGQSAVLASETDRLKRRIVENFKDIGVYLGNIFLPAIDFVFSGLRGSLADLTDDYAGYLEAMIEMHLLTGTVTEEMATQTIRAWVDMGRITVSEALKICEHLGLMNEDVMALIQQAQKAGVEVPESFRNISFSVDQTKQKLESLKNSIQGLNSAFSLINVGAQTIMGFYDAVAAVEKALGRDVELTEEASQSKQRLAAVSQVLSFMTNSLNMVMQALQFHQLGAKEAGDMLLN